MPLTRERLFYLLNAYSASAATEAEQQELFEWVNMHPHNYLVLQHIQNLAGQPDTGENTYHVAWEKVYEKILDNSIAQTPPVIITGMPWPRMIAAALIFILVGTIVYLYLNKAPAKTNLASTPVHQPQNKDVAAPSKSRAVLTLADGSKIELDSIANGMLAQQGSVQVVKQSNGQITYNGTGSENLYNTLNVPRGSKVVVIKLSDGTQVWLNSESSLRYPASFTGAERKVEITGEAYFEVAHNAAMPFIVKKDGLEVKVLGTHFNINTYADEGMDKITLLEGSINISVNRQQQLLRPGQQASIDKEIKLVNGINIGEVMAWKNGIFQFGEKATLHGIMKKIERWYDVEVAYESGAISQHFGGEIPMSSNLSQVLEILKTSGVKFTINGKKVIVQP